MTDCKITMAEVRNRMVLDNNIGNVDAYAEHIVVWSFEAERKIATGDMFSTGQEKLLTVDGTKVRIPDYVHSLDDICVPGHSIVFTEGHLHKRCGCSCDSCCCIKISKNGKYLNFSREVDSVWLFFTGVEVDEFGFPLIDESHVDAITTYVEYKLLCIRYKEGKLAHHIYKEWDAKYKRQFKAARSKDNMPNEAERRIIDRIFNSKLPIDYNHYCDYISSCNGGSCGTGSSGSGSGGSSGGSGGGVNITNNITNITNITTGNWDVDVVTGDGTNTYTNSAFIGLSFDSDMFIYYDGTTLQIPGEVVSFDSTTGTITYVATITNGKVYRIFYRIL